FQRHDDAALRIRAARAERGLGLVNFGMRGLESVGVNGSRCPSIVELRSERSQLRDEVRRGLRQLGSVLDDDTSVDVNALDACRAVCDVSYLQFALVGNLGRRRHAAAPFAEFAGELYGECGGCSGCPWLPPAVVG